MPMNVTFYNMYISFDKFLRTFLANCKPRKSLIQVGKVI